VSREMQMVRVLVVANHSLLADAIEWMLAQEIDLDVLRLTHRELGNVDQAIREHRSVLIFVAEGVSEDELMAARDWFRDDGRLLVITIGPEKHDLYICESYQIPNPGMAQVVNLIRAFSRI